MDTGVHQFVSGRLLKKVEQTLAYEIQVSAQGREETPAADNGTGRA